MNPLRAANGGKAVEMYLEQTATASIWFQDALFIKARTITLHYI